MKLKQVLAPSSRSSIKLRGKSTCISNSNLSNTKEDTLFNFKKHYCKDYRNFRGQSLPYKKL